MPSLKRFALATTALMSLAFLVTVVPVRRALAYMGQLVAFDQSDTGHANGSNSVWVDGGAVSVSGNVGIAGGALVATGPGGGPISTRLPGDPPGGAPVYYAQTYDVLIGATASDNYQNVVVPPGFASWTIVGATINVAGGTIIATPVPVGQIPAVQQTAAVGPGGTGSALVDLQLSESRLFSGHWGATYSGLRFQLLQNSTWALNVHRDGGTAGVLNFRVTYWGFLTPNPS